MAKKQTIKDLYDKPFADEANKGFRHLVEYCLDQYRTFKDSKYRNKKLQEIADAVSVYNQEVKPTSDPWEGACFHPDVEVLTDSGWKLISFVRAGDMVMSREPVTGVISYQTVSDTFEYDAPKDGLYRLKNLFFDIQVTGNHKFPVERTTHEERRSTFVTVDEIIDGFPDQQRWRLPLSGVWEAENAITLFGHDPGDFMELLGWYLSEGWVFQSRCIGISQSKTANPGKCVEIEELLDRMGFEYTYKGSTYLIRVDLQLANHLREIGNSKTKHIPRMYLDLSRENLQRLFESMVSGDGHITWHKDKNRNFPSTTYYTISRKLADDFQELCLKLGYSAYISSQEPYGGGIIRGRKISGKNTQYKVSVRYTDFTRFRHNRCTVERVEYSGKVYCISVPPHHTLYVRQNGKPLWSGNSNITMPLTTISCDNLEPRMVSGLVGKYPYVRFEMPLDQEKDETTELLQEWFNQELQDTVGAEKLARSIIHRILQDGTVYVLPYYDIDEETRTDFVFEDDVEALVKKDPERSMAIANLIQSGRFVFENGMLMDLETAEPVTQDVYEPIFEGGRYSLIPFNDIYIADDVDDWEKALVIRKVYPTYAELVRDADRKQGYVNIGPWLYSEATEGTLSNDTASKSQIYDGVLEHGKATIECIECTLSYIHVGDDEEEKDNTNLIDEKILVQIALNSRILVRAIPLRKIYHKNMHLIKRIRMFPEDGKSYGTGLAPKLKAIQDGASKTFNMAINIAEVTMIPWFLFEEKTGMKNRYKDGISLKIGQGLPVDSVQGLYFPQFSVNPDQMFNWINLWVSFWERVSSIGDLQVGRQGDKDRTATETMAVIQEGNIKHNYQSTSIREDFLSVLTCLYDLYYQHMPFNKTFFWKGQFVPVPRSAMRRMKNFRLTGSTEQSNKLIERQEKETFYTLTASDQNINPIKRSEELVKAYGHNDTADWVSPQIAQVVQAIMQTPGASDMVMQMIGQLQAEQHMMAQAQGQQQ